MNGDLQGIAIPFFTAQQWREAKNIMEDGHTFEASYAEFVQRVINAEATLRRQGKATIRIHIEPQVFAQWCKASGRKINAESRAHYAAITAQQTESSRKN